MAITINPKTITLSNGTANDATKVEQIQTDLFENDETLKTAINALVDGSSAFDLLTTDYITEETATNGIYIDSMRAKDGYVNVAPVRAEIGSVNTTSDTITTTATHNITTGTPGRLRALFGATLPGGTTESALYYFRAPTTNTLTLHTTAADAGTGANPVNLTSAGTTGAARQIIADPLNFKEADFWINQYAFIRLNGTTQRLLTANTALLTGYINGKAPTWTSIASITIPTGLTARDSTSVEDIAFASDQVVSLAVSGAGGLDTGSEASDTWYYLYVIKNVSTGVVSAVFSVTNESSSGSITLPAGYALKRQLPIAVRNDASSNLLKWSIGAGWPYRPHIVYNDYDWSSSIYRALSSGTATTFTAVALTGFVPPISRVATLQGTPGANVASTQYVRTTGASTTNGWNISQAGASFSTTSFIELPTNSSQSVEYKTTSASCSLSLDVLGYVVTEVS